MIYWIFYIVLGFISLILGANWLINGASILAKKFHVSDLVIGLTIVAFGTSAPELIVNSIASMNGHNEIVLGNIIGSNNFNLFIILGIAGLIYPIKVTSTTVWREIPISLCATLLLYVLANDFFVGKEHVISRIDGIILVVCFSGFMYYIFQQMKKERNETQELPGKISDIKLVVLIIVGLAGLVIGGHVVVGNSIKFASALGVSEKTIGLTIIAAGTSLPELVTSIVAAFKQKSDIAIGNVIGSNIFNIFFILGISTIISPLPYPNNFNTEVYLLFSGTVFLILGMVTGVRKQLDRWESLILIVSFAAYTFYLLQN